MILEFLKQKMKLRSQTKHYQSTWHLYNFITIILACTPYNSYPHFQTTNCTTHRPSLLAWLSIRYFLAVGLILTCYWRCRCAQFVLTGYQNRAAFACHSTPVRQVEGRTTHVLILLLHMKQVSRNLFLKYRFSRIYVLPNQNNYLTSRAVQLIEFRLPTITKREQLSKNV